MKSLFGNLFDNMEKGFDKLSNSMDNMFCNNSTIISGSNVSMSDINGNITINGVNVTEKYGITKAKNIVINNGKIFVDGKEITDDIADEDTKAGTFNGNISIKIEGTVNGGIDTDGDVYVDGEVNGGIDTKGTVNVTGNVSGDVDTNGTVTVGGNVGRDIDTNGSVTVGGSVGGSIDTNGPVNVGK